MNERFDDIVDLVSKDSVENDTLLKNIKTELDEDVQAQIMETFLITALSKKIHPISLESIRMGCNPKYLQYCRSRRTELNRARILGKLWYCVRIFKNRLVEDRIGELQSIIESHIGFAPDKRFCVYILRSFNEKLE